MSFDEKTIREKRITTALQLTEAPEWFRLHKPRIYGELRYKKDRYERNNRELPVVKYGDNVVFRCYGERNIVGYGLGRIIDWETRDWWYSVSTQFYFVVTEVTSAKLTELVGRIRHGCLNDGRWGGGACIVSFDRNDLPKIRPE